MRVTSVPVTLAEEDSLHAPGAMGIRKGRTYRESCKSGRSVTGLFCLFGIMPELWGTLRPNRKAAHSRDRIGIPGWAPIFEGLPVGARGRSSRNLHFLP